MRKAIHIAAIVWIALVALPDSTPCQEVPADTTGQAPGGEGVGEAPAETPAEAPDDAAAARRERLRRASAAAAAAIRDTMPPVVETGPAVLEAIEAREAGRDEGTEGAAGRAVGGVIPSPDDVYSRILGTRRPGIAPGPESGPIQYQGQRLQFYPETEVIVLEDAASAEQSGTRLDADGRILFRNREGIVEAFERVTISRGTQEVRADSLFYDRGTGAVATYGMTGLTEGPSQSEGTDLRYDMDTQSGRLGRGVTLDPPWILEGQIDKIGSVTYRVDEGHFTTCDLDEPHYRFVSDEIKMRREDVIVASPVVLYFSDIPVFYLPWYVEPVSTGRHSGFLRPQIGINSLLFGSGNERNIQDLGYYWVLGDYADVEVSADFYTESRFVLRGSGRYSKRHEFRGNLAVEQVWNQLDDSSSRMIRYNHDQTLSSTSRASVSVNWSNSRRFLQRNSFDPGEILQRSFRSAGSYTNRYPWGSLVVGADADFQLESDRTDFRLPDIRLSISQRPLWGPKTTGPATERPFLNRLQYSANFSLTSRFSRAPVDSLGNPLTSLPTDSLGNPIETDKETVVNEQDGRVRFSLSGPFDLFGVIKTSPSLSYDARFENDELAEGDKFGAQGQLRSGVSFNTKFFRIFERAPGPFTAMRHTVSPTIRLSYSPKANLFGALEGGTTRESFTASFGLTQDFDVKIPERTEEEGDEGAEEEGDETGENGDRDEEDVPTRTLNLLSISSSMPFDILAHRKDDELGFGRLSTRISSGLGRSFNVSATMNHALVKRGEAREVFNPFLESLSMDFSIRGGGFRSPTRDPIVDDDVRAGRGDEEQEREAQEQLDASRQEQLEGFGPWTVGITHQWSRRRGGDGNRQSVGLSTSLLPSPQWSLNYRTTFDISEGDMQGQTLSLVRDLHDWQAALGISFFPAEPQDRVLIEFSVFLRDVPDLEVPYRVRRE